jgi:hypothetical protein
MPFALSDGAFAKSEAKSEASAKSGADVGVRKRAFVRLGHQPGVLVPGPSTKEEIPLKG